MESDVHDRPCLFNLVGRGAIMVKCCIRGISTADIDESVEHAVVGRVVIIAEIAGLVNGVVGQDFVVGAVGAEAILICDVAVVIVGDASELVDEGGLVKQIVFKNPGGGAGVVQTQGAARNRQL